MSCVPKELGGTGRMSLWSLFHGNRQDDVERLNQLLLATNIDRLLPLQLMSACKSCSFLKYSEVRVGQIVQEVVAKDFQVVWKADNGF
eukprot:scaffold30262_cov19-Tisochrysis_lutea.AAC.5